MAAVSGTSTSRLSHRDAIGLRLPCAASWSVWVVAATFYLAAFYLRTSPAVMTTELMRDFGISASQLGQFSAFYFYAYIAMQIPTGVLVDSWGARRLLIAGSLAAAAGTFLFGATSSYALASLGRAIVGGATAVGWVVTLKLATHWFPRAALRHALGPRADDGQRRRARSRRCRCGSWSSISGGARWRWDPRRACWRSARPPGRSSPTIPPTAASRATRPPNFSGPSA